jgi:hypothetical protein
MHIILYSKVWCVLLVMVFYATFNNILIISCTWQSVLWLNEVIICQKHVVLSIHITYHPQYDQTLELTTLVLIGTSNLCNQCLSVVSYVATYKWKIDFISLLIKASFLTDLHFKFLGVGLDIKDAYLYLSHQHKTTLCLIEFKNRLK